MERAPRSSAEIEAIARALVASRGDAPSWLSGELSGGDILAVSRTPEGPRSLLAAGLCLASLFGMLALGMELDVSPARGYAGARRPAPVDFAALEAVSLAQAWSPAGDELPALERLGGARRHHGGLRAWSAESVGPGSYLVLYREPGGASVAFEVDLNERLVRGTPEAVDKLTLLRVREESGTGAMAAAR